MQRLLILFAVLASVSVMAAPPPGHPSPEQARDMLMPEKPPVASELPNVGKVLSSIDANDFTYIEVDRAGSKEWIAAPKMALKPGSTIRYEDGSVMSDFYSKLLKRTFPSVMFVGHVAVVGD
ncbi:MAG: hypothetical protein HZA62_04085 [Rhodocyclales bacterium]|nr:hypothetical protein [Rhodocyclales bacterium]